jgi:hypothetical protein
VALGATLFEWLAPNTYLRFFDVIHYYIARGTTTEYADTAAGRLTMADARFGFFLCIFTLAIHPAARMIRPTMLSPSLCHDDCLCTYGK